MFEYCNMVWLKLIAEATMKKFLFVSKNFYQLFKFKISKYKTIYPYNLGFLYKDTKFEANEKALSNMIYLSSEIHKYKVHQFLN